nr:hypothetical protein [Mesorhizobium sp.]
MTETTPDAVVTAAAGGLDKTFSLLVDLGGLTLNVLLSFAQFEREVTAERIRDKVAASKKKGMWMGGIVPLGYRVDNRKLVIDETEAQTVKHLFDRYLTLKSVGILSTRVRVRGSRHGCDNARTDQLPSPCRLVAAIFTTFFRTRSTSARSGTRIKFTMVSASRSSRRHCSKRPRHCSPLRRRGGEAIPMSRNHLLTGLLYHEAGEKLRSVHANKQGVRYRYYVSKQFVDRRRNESEG